MRVIVLLLLALFAVIVRPSDPAFTVRDSLAQYFTKNGAAQPKELSVTSGSNSSLKKKRHLRSIHRQDDDNNNNNNNNNNANNNDNDNNDDDYSNGDDNTTDDAPYTGTDDAQGDDDFNAMSGFTDDFFTGSGNSRRRAQRRH